MKDIKTEFLYKKLGFFIFTSIQKQILRDSGTNMVSKSDKTQC